ncbi:DUF445 domain-containing protein [Indioceanicola profundi]|uniref:DUF445 domain-containing protein n=1 Tax=Indioceanicola profundi TaxID=2220096 RepID=UPI000E6AD578|nr:DUF445 domain-containing protein [Indioceanicola profundi]
MPTANLPTLHRSIDDENTRVLEQELRRDKLLAGSCLGLAAAAWGATHAVDLPPGWAGALRAMAEAGLVGGLADWFAVTALFRRPLGLPIPHTALIPRNRDRIADGIANYIDNEFLAPDMLVEQLRRMDLAARLATLLHDEASRNRVTELAMRMLPGMMAEEKDAAIRGALTRAVQDAVKQVDLRRPLARVLRAVVESDALEALLGEMSDRLIMMVQDRRAWLQEAVEKRSRWWIPSSVDKRVAGNLADAAVEHLYDLRSPHSDVGKDLRRWLADLPEEVERGGPIGERLTSVVGAALNDANFQQLVDRAVGTMRRIALEDMERDDSRIREVIGAAVASLAAQLDDAELRARINASLEDAFVAAIPRWREKIRTFISGTLRSQDVEDFTRRLELRVGRDLQYIRINGTILGAAIGGVLWLLNGWLEGGGPLFG